MSRTTVEIVGKETVSQAAHKAASASKQLSDSTGGLVRNFTDLTAAGLAVGKAIQLVSQFAEQSIQEFAAQERAVLGWSAAMAGSDRITKDQAKSLREYAEQMAVLTGEDDEAILSMQSFLVTSGRTEEEMRKLISAAADMSVVTGEDLRTSVEKLNATYSGTAGRLDRIIPQLGELTKEQLESGAAIDIISEKYKGLSQALGESTDVSIKNYKKALSDLTAEIGESISMGFTPLRNWLTDLIRQWGNATNAANEYARAQAKAKGEKGFGILSKEELENLNKMNQALIEQRKQSLQSGAWAGREGTAEYRTASKGLEDLIEENRKVTEALRNLTVGSAYANYDAGAAPATAGLAEAVKQGIAAYDWDRGFSPVFDSMGLSIADGMKPVLDDFNAYAHEYNFSPLTEAIRENTAAQPSQGGGDAGGFSLFGGQDMSFLTLLGEAIGPLISQIGSLNAIINWGATILSGVMDILEPLIDSILTPIVGALRVLGQLIGLIIAPLLQALAPIITALAQGFVWLYNNVLRPFGLMIVMITAMIVNAVVGFVNFFAWILGLPQLSYMNVNAETIPTITMDDLNAAGSTTIESTGGSTGSSASYAQARDITINIQVNTSALVGDGGINQFAVIISRELRSAGLLGVA